jgi:membrane protein involved in colicin uptake
MQQNDSVIVKTLQEDAVALANRYRELVATKEQVDKELARVKNQYEYIENLTGRLKNQILNQAPPTQAQEIKQQPLPKNTTAILENEASPRVEAMMQKVAENLQTESTQEEIQAAKVKAQELLDKTTEERAKKEKAEAEKLQKEKEKVAAKAAKKAEELAKKEEKAAKTTEKETQKLTEMSDDDWGESSAPTTKTSSVAVVDSDDDWGESSIVSSASSNTDDDWG